MSKDLEKLDKSYVFYKNLHRPSDASPPKDKKLTFIHKLSVSAVLARKYKDLPSTISYFEWDYVKNKLMRRLTIAGFVLSPIPFYYLFVRPIMNYQDKWMAKAELKKYGEVRENETFRRW